MPRSLVRPTLASLLLAFVCTASARAETPPASNSSVPNCITLVGSSGVVPASVGTFEVIARDLANNPVAGAPVVIDLSLATDLRLCDDQLDPNLIVSCANRTATKFTGLDGRVVFTLLGGGTTGGRTLAGAGRVYLNGFLIGFPSVNTFDADGDAGVGANDMSLWLADFGSGLDYGRSDYDCSGDLGANDFSVWLMAFGSGAQTSSCAVSCP